jgi:carboxyl-terminal processing protease
MDLRNNPGGLVEQSVRVSDLFLENGLIVSTEGRGQKEEAREFAHPKGTQPKYPLAVLINEGSASASEIVAGALQDHKRAMIVGTRSFGKGSVQTIIELEDHSALKLTIAKYYTPNHRSIQDHGITPDVEIEPDGSKPGDADGGTPSKFDPDAGVAQFFTAHTVGDLQLNAALERVKKAAK